MNNTCAHLEPAPSFLGTSTASTEATVVTAAPSRTFPGVTHSHPATAHDSQMPPSLRTGQNKNFLGWVVTSLWPSCILASLRESYRQHLTSTWYKSPAPSSLRDTAQAKFTWLSGAWNLEQVSYQLSPYFDGFFPCSICFSHSLTGLSWEVLP